MPAGRRNQRKTDLAVIQVRVTVNQAYRTAKAYRTKLPRRPYIVQIMRGLAHAIAVSTHRDGAFLVKTPLQTDASIVFVIVRRALEVIGTKAGGKPKLGSLLLLDGGRSRRGGRSGVAAVCGCYSACQRCCQRTCQFDIEEMPRYIAHHIFLL